jgi:hypothetical protein
MFAMQAWGIDIFPRTFPSGQRIDISADHLYFQFPDRQTVRNAYALEFWPFPRTALERAVVQDGLLVLPEFRHVFYARALVQFIVVDDTNPLMSLGLVVTNHVFDTFAPSGVSLSAPSDRKMERVMWAVSPPPRDEPLRSADYEDAWPNLPPPRAVVSRLTRTPKNAVDRLWGRKP